MTMAALVVTSSAALAAEDAAQRAARCASVADSLERLVCYDRVFAPARAGTEAPASPAPTPAPATPVQPPAVASGAAPQAAPAAPRSAADDFGEDQIRRQPSESAGQPRSLTGKVRELRETRPNVYRIALENGQVWQQMDMDSLFQVEVGDTVEINRGRMGGYRMARQSRGGSGWVRVNRIK